MAGGLFGGGNGSAGSPWLIEDAQDLNAVRNDSARYYKQINHIDLTDFVWVPIYPFSGSFNGNGFEIRNLTVDVPSNSYVGFISLFNAGLLERISLVNVNITGNSYVGGLVGEFTGGEIKNCSVTGVITGYSNGCGGLVGRTTKAGIAAQDCYTNCEVNGTYDVGGFSGYHAGGNSNSVAFIRCYSSGSVRGVQAVGGFSSKVIGICEDCYSLVNTIVRTSGASTTFGKFVASDVSSAEIVRCFSLAEMEFQG
jgi:hypothetical protein